ncbi:unnamed protein product [Prorocentrum cordatum]|uniref:Uncharacterized protein n=1 Tax=Prorocentrum cordatum TaxID=2364126 RepID=A0ABN9VI34_9DINO|nr:unnamed protein product [Polarella glacialis]
MFALTGLVRIRTSSSAPHRRWSCISQARWAAAHQCANVSMPASLSSSQSSSSLLSIFVLAPTPTSDGIFCWPGVLRAGSGYHFHGLDFRRMSAATISTCTI